MTQAKTATKRNIDRDAVLRAVDTHLNKNGHFYSSYFTEDGTLIIKENFPNDLGIYSEWEVKLKRRTLIKKEARKCSKG